MLKLKNISIISLLLVVITLISIADFSSNEVVKQYLALNPKLIIEKYEFWRIITYSLISNSLESYVFLFIAFFYFAPKLENIFGTKVFSLSLLLVAGLFGLISNVVFFKQNLVIATVDQLSLYTFALFSFLNYKRRINFFDKFSFPLSYLSTAFIVTWIISKSWNIAIFGGNYLNEVVFPVSFTLFLTTSMYIRLLLMDKSSFKKQKVRNDFVEKEIEEYAPALIEKDELRRYMKKIEEDITYANYKKNELSEDNLNEILDKIIEKGQSSLSSSEKEFLTKYSEHLK
jgi:membrane associated rhomboid family serine protease